MDDQVIYAQGHRNRVHGTEITGASLDMRAEKKNLNEKKLKQLGKRKTKMVSSIF
jgi:hypothetical protein